MTVNLMAILDARVSQSTTVPETFFTVEAEHIAEACWSMARRFHLSGRLLAFGNGSWATDAQHVAVEFVHPVIVGKRALPALALTNDSATLSGMHATTEHPEGAFARLIGVLARPQDIAMGFSVDGNCANVNSALYKAHEMGLLTIGLCGNDGGHMARHVIIPGEECMPLKARDAFLDYCFVVPSADPLAIQETHETLYHVLWELVHVFFEHEGVLQ
ncbi:D-sedoheptulose-7-phosphate isomerase [Dictyobacter aurantiacus]|uniref:Phosphoheptose isomerase n=1 Tax=Dictyobacter aurantiacus TaxID=1936993 RepID=A0A401ZNJ2_9CHLR|nr:SIS domain-containing protein [Dictyobacter aurantiacus]GCE08422.1 phosphoheptose isomerase [Dictyobacter aurantiacus]